MSQTTSITLEEPPLPSSAAHDYNASSASTTTVLTQTACPKCGHCISHPDMQTLQTAQARIQELESQVRILTLRATSAVERATEYEVSLRRMASQKAAQQQQTAAQSATSRLARLLSTRSVLSAAASAPTTTVEPPRTSSAPPGNTAVASPPGSPPSNSNAHQSAAQTAAQQQQQSAEALALQAQLEEEQSLRRAAESAAAKTNSEIEELTGQLFEQANQMVAQERKARAKLEARVEVLEKRDNDKAKRLGLLEMRVQRVERVRGLLENREGLPGVGVGKEEKVSASG